MATINKIESVVAKLQKLAADAKNDDVSVVVGYTAKYALFVHENREMKWRGFPRDQSIRKGNDSIAYTGYEPSKKRGLFWGPNGRAGFLLDVAREMSKELAAIIYKALEKKQTMAKALLLAGLRLQRESQQNVPVDTGNLRASAFTRVE